MIDLKKKAALANGLASSAVIKTARPGAVYTIIDKAIHFPDERLPTAGPRALHAKRYAIVIQAGVLCTSMWPNTVMVVPCSSSSKAGTCDFSVDDAETAFPDNNVVAFTSLIQPILKSELLSFSGHLTGPELLKIQAVILRNMGIIGQGTVATSPASTKAVPVQTIAPTPIAAAKFEGES